MQTHRELYPDQYAHPLVGQTVKVVSKKDGSTLAQGNVERVVNSRYGQLAKIAGAGTMFYAVRDCHTVEEG